jgi:serine/threonine-protein kinase
MSAEAHFLTKLTAEPGDDATRLVYADWLTDQGDNGSSAKSEFLRAAVELTRQAGHAGDEERRGRLRQLATGLDTEWVAVVSPLPMENRNSDVAVCAGYTILREVAVGALTVVYEAEHTHLEGRRTLKIVRSADPGVRDRFLRLAQINARLDHPRLPAINEVGCFQGLLYLARQFVEGDDLQNGIANTLRPISEVARIVAEVAGALDYSHGRGVVHAYVHPRHLLLGEDGSAWLIGFGEFPPAHAATFTNPVQLAPEQLEAGGPLTPQTDVYGLAETAFWLLGGRHPFHGFRGGSLVAAKGEGCLRWSLRELRRDVPRGVDDVLRRGLAPRPEDRFTSAGEFAAALSAAVQPTAKRWLRFWT